ncbi:PREDICTED: uncharacterized protein LOC107336203, partial [Acropora digitifera]|uniref:uncharacterized protein LOC107336203 n=1 Tax=Acropora digitifera TaxID=70779 RepID=UPI00077B1C8A
RQAFVTILYHLCGYLTPEQINGLLKRLGLDAQGTITFEKFVTHFQDNEVLRKEWVDPVVRPTLQTESQANLPAKKLQQRQREIAMEQKRAELKKGRKKTPPKFYSALEVFPHLKRKAQQGTLSYKNILPPSCFDVDGMVLKPQLKTALQFLGFQMYEEEFEKVWDRFDKTGLGAVDSFVFFKTLGINPFRGKYDHRCSVQEGNMVPYKKIMDLFLDRSEKGRLQAILDDPKHRFNCSRESAIGNTSAVDAEAKLLDIMQSDFLALLGAFKQLDRDNLGVVKRYQFKDLLETRFYIKLTDEELSSIARPLRANYTDALIPYAEFLELFSSSRDTKTASTSGKVLSPRGGSGRPKTSPKEVSSPRRLVSRKELERSATELEITKKETQPRSAHALFAVLRDLLTDRFQAIFKAFQGMDQIKKGFLSKGMFQRLFERYGVNFSSPEIDLLFSKLPSEANGFINFEELVQYSFLNYNVSSRETGEGQSGTLSHLLQEYAKSVVPRKLDPVPEEMETNLEVLPTPPSQIQENER